MKRKILAFVTFSAALTLPGCDRENWVCVEQSKTLFSMDGKKVGSADKGCSCEEIVEFNLRNFGSRGDSSDFGC
jgi:hypothetical protein